MVCAVLQMYSQFGRGGEYLRAHGISASEAQLTLVPNYENVDAYESSYADMHYSLLADNLLLGCG